MEEAIMKRKTISNKRKNKIMSEIRTHEIKGIYPVREIINKFFDRYGTDI
jgi:hypothetical protein